MVISTQKSKHPAPLPETIVYPDDNKTLKLPPPDPLLKVSKVVIDIESYQLYTYKEIEKTLSTSMWKKIGDICALKLPMACTLTQLSEGNKYYFAVRAVDKHSRV